MLIIPRNRGLRVECQASAGLPCAVVQAVHCQKSPGKGGKWGLKSILKSFLKVGEPLSNWYKSTFRTSTGGGY